MLKKHIVLLVSVILAFICVSCEPEEDFGFPSKIEMSGKGETIEIKGSNDMPSFVVQIELLDYDGNGNNSGLLTEGNDCMETTTDWLTVRYFQTEDKLVLVAEPNKTNKKRKLYLYLLSGKSRQEITVVQTK